MILNIQPLAQRDSRWANQRLGTVNATTIGSHGCVITAMAMIASYYGHPIFPNTLDDILTERGLYFDGNLYVNNSITKIYPDIKFDKVTFCETIPAPITEIKSYLDQKKPIVVALINQGIRHYILVVGYEGDKIYANDPWQGDRVAINDRWGDPVTKILQVNYFSGPVPQHQTPTPVTNPSQDQTSINLGSELGFMEIGAIRSEILDLRRVRGGLEQDLSNLQRRISELEASKLTINDQTKIDLGSEIGILEVGAIKSQILDLRRDKKDLEQQLIIVSTSTKVTPVDDKADTSTVIELNPVTPTIPVQVDKWAPFRSRKFILSAVASLIAFLNTTLNLGLDQEQMLTTIAPILTYIGVEGVADVVERAKKLPMATSYVEIPKNTP